MDLEQLRNFQLVVEAGSMSGAAKKKYITSQAMLQQMNALEAEIGAQLLERTPRGVTCTPAGSYLYERVGTVRAYIDLVLKECQRIGNEEPQNVRIGQTTLPLFGSVLQRVFERAHPTAHIEFVPVDMADAVQALEEGRVDVVDFGEEPIWLPDCLRYDVVAAFRPEAMVAPDSPLAELPVISRGDLEDVVVGTRDGYLAYDPFDRDKFVFPGEFDLRPLTKSEAIMLCLDGGVFITHHPLIASLYPLVTVPVDRPLMDAGLVSRKDAPPVVRAYVDNAQRIFGTL